MVDMLEKKKETILSIFMNAQDRYMESSEAVNTFLENYNTVRFENIQIKLINLN